MFSAETNRFDRFLVSIAIICFALAGLIPWFVFSRLDVLTVTRSELDRLTPTAADVIERRQEALQVVQGWLVVVAVGLLLLGVFLLLWGGRSLHKAQATDDERLGFERDQVKYAALMAKRQWDSVLAEQTDEELEVIQEEREAEVVAELTTEPDQARSRASQADAQDDRRAEERKAEDPGAPVAPLAHGSRLADLAREGADRRRSLEDAVLAMLPNVQAPGYRLLTHRSVRSRADPEVSPLRLDAVFVPPSDLSPHVIVEVKVRSGMIGSKNSSRAYVEQTLSHVQDYWLRTGAKARCWLIVVLDPATVDPIDLERTLMKNLLGAGRADVLVPGRLTRLTKVRVPEDV